MTRRHNHLTNSIPNNRFTHWLVKWVNRRMRKDGSKYFLRIKYRKPKKGARYSYGGDLKNHEARRFALYLSERPESAAMRKERAAKKVTMRIMRGGE